MSKLFFVSDYHFGHENIIRYSNRPFKTVAEMNKKLIENHNSKVKKEDTVYNLGDMFFRQNAKEASDILNQLNGKHVLLWGNHDKVARQIYHQFEKTYDYKELKVTHNGQSIDIIMSHYPLLSWNKSRYGSFMIHGHCHGGVDHLNTNVYRHDVGVDSNDYYPVSLEELIVTMKKKEVDFTYQD